MRYLAHIAYLGTSYRGWQRQNGVVSVQELIESALLTILGEKANAVGCGRTDAGVHASQYCFHFDISSTRQMTESENITFQYILNKELPEDISVFDIIPVEPNFHAQHNATLRTYHYFFHTVKDPFLANVSALYLNMEFDFDLMQKAVDLIPKINSEGLTLSGTLTGSGHDFRAFCTTPEKHSSTLCRIESVQLQKNKEGTRFSFTISADRFLRSMVRTIAGKLIEIGIGRMSPEEFELHLLSGKSFKFQNQAYPQGLFLSRVVYPGIELERQGAMPVF